MPRLAPCRANPDRNWLLPYVNQGDYYVMRNPITGNTRYVYPRMMQERHFAMVEGPYGLGTTMEEAAGIFGQSLFDAAQQFGVSVSEAAAQTAEAAAREVQAVAEANQNRRLQSNQNIQLTPVPMQQTSSGPSTTVLALGGLALLALGYWYMKRRRRNPLPPWPGIGPSPSFILGPAFWLGPAAL